MTWITSTRMRISHTHYYLGLTSICEDAHIESESSHMVRIKYDVSYCEICQMMLKSKKMHRTIQDRYDKLNRTQEKEKAGNRPRLEDQLLNIIHHSDTILPVKISQIKETFHHFYPAIDIEDIILSLVTSKKC